MIYGKNLLFFWEPEIFLAAKQRVPMWLAPGKNVNFWVLYRFTKEKTSHGGHHMGVIALFAAGELVNSPWILIEWWGHGIPEHRLLQNSACFFSLLDSCYVSMINLSSEYNHVLSPLGPSSESWNVWTDLGSWKHSQSDSEPWEIWSPRPN